MKSPRYWALQHELLPIHLNQEIGRNEKPETLGIATL